jgi:hypothetical protein
MKILSLTITLLASFSLLAGGGVGDGPIRKIVIKKDMEQSKYPAKEKDCEGCDGVESYHRMMDLIKKDDEKYIESITAEILKGAI